MCLNILHRNYLKSDPLGVQRVADSIGMARRVGVQVVLLPFFGPGALKTTAEMDYVGDLLRELGPQAEKAGIVLGLEDTISARDNVRIMERSQSAAVKTYYDVGNSIKQGFDIIEEIRWLGNARICEVHLKDNPHYLGEGPINFPAVIDALGDIGFDKWAELETDTPSKDVKADMTRNLVLGAHQGALWRSREGADAEELRHRLHSRTRAAPNTYGHDPLHNGSSVADALVAGGVPGRVVACADPLHDGPCLPGLSRAEWSDTPRALSRR